MPHEKPEKTSEGIWKLPGGKITLSPGGSSSKRCYDFRFANTGSDPICDFEIICEDLDVFCFDPEIAPQNEPSPKGPGVTVTGVGKLDANGKLVKPAAPATAPTYTVDDADNKDDASSHVSFKIKPCIAPGEVVDIGLCFTKPLQDNEEITFWPSNGASRPMTGSSDIPDPTRPSDLLKGAFKLGGAVIPLVPNPLSMKTTIRELEVADPTLGLALRSALDRTYRDVPLGRLGELPTRALRGNFGRELAELAEGGTLAEVWETDAFQRLALLFDLSRRGRPGD